MKRSSTLVTIVIATMLFVGLPFAFATDDTPHFKDTLRLERVMHFAPSASQPV